jgi:hypothetical protein
LSRVGDDLLLESKVFLACPVFLFKFAQKHAPPPIFLKTSAEMYSKVKCKLVVVESLLKYFDDLGYVKVIITKGLPMTIFNIHPEGKRYFRNVLQ